MPLRTAHDSTTIGPGRPKDLAKRGAVLGAAKELFLRNGYAGTSMDAVAAAAGVSKLTVYSHFTDKETLYSAAVVARCEEQMPSLLFELPAGKPVKLLLQDIGRSLLSLVNSPESLELHRLMITTGASDPRLSQAFFEAAALRTLREMERLLTRLNGVDGLAFANPYTAAEHFCSLIKGISHLRLLIGYPPPADPRADEHHVEEVVDLFMRAYRSEDGPVTRS